MFNLYLFVSVATFTFINYQLLVPLRRESASLLIYFHNGTPIANWPEFYNILLNNDCKNHYIHQKNEIKRKHSVESKTKNKSEIKENI